MAFPTQETRDQARLARIASEGFEFIDDVFVKTNQLKRTPNYQRQTYPTVKSPNQPHLGKIGKDGFKVIDEVYDKKKVNPIPQTPHKYYQQAAFVQHGTQPVTLTERAANSNIESTVSFYGANKTITSEEAAKLYSGYQINEYGKRRN